MTNDKSQMTDFAKGSCGISATGPRFVICHLISAAAGSCANEPKAGWRAGTRSASVSASRNSELESTRLFAGHFWVLREPRPTVIFYGSLLPVDRVVEDFDIFLDNVGIQMLVLQAQVTRLETALGL